LSVKNYDTQLHNSILTGTMAHLYEGDEITVNIKETYNFQNHSSKTLITAKINNIFSIASEDQSKENVPDTLSTLQDLLKSETRGGTPYASCAMAAHGDPIFVAKALSQVEQVRVLYSPF